MPKINLISLGCPKNTVDSERMLHLLANNGYTLTEEASEADVIVVNTCGFIEPAKRESIDTILDAAQMKTSGRCRGIIVTGCLAQRYGGELQKDLREADRIIGLREERDIVRHCDELLGRPPRPVRRDGGRALTTPAHWAYLRISDGCDRTCAFCAIPGIKGPNRSETVEDLVEETERLVSSGVKEIALVAQDTMRYGADIYGRSRLVDLVQALLRVKGLSWLRLHYTYPSGWSDALIELVAGEEKLCGYVDMPVQHISDRVLKAMRRGTTQRGIRSLILKLKERIPHLTLRTSVIVGFPEETDADFEALCEFVEEVRFHRLGGFLYSSEEDTDAGLMIDTVPARLKQERLDQLMEIQRDISEEANRALVGTRVQALVDAVSEDPAYDAVGRTRRDAPEIDGEVLIRGAAKVGSFAEVEVTDAFAYDLVGRVAAAGDTIQIQPPRAQSKDSRPATRVDPELPAGRTRPQGKG